jgi:hypothetical protein
MRERNAGRGIRRLGRKALIAGLGCVAAGALAAPAAQASFGIGAFGVATYANGTGGVVTPVGEFSRQAGAHANLETVVHFSGDETIRNIAVDFPPGVMADPTVTDHCTARQLVGVEAGPPLCPKSSQVGVVVIDPEPGSSEPAGFALYNVDRPANLPALLGFNYQGVIFFFEPNLRPDDYGIRTRASNVPIAKIVPGTTVRLWAVPADPSHDGERGTNLFLGLYGNEPGPVSAPKFPFLTNPTSCPSAPTPFSAEVQSWQSPQTYGASNSSDTEGTPFQWEGCDRIPFKPTMKVDPGTHRAAATTGLQFNVTVPQSDDPGGLATSHLKRIATTFPQGMTASPSAVAGLGACSEAQIGLGTDKEPSCPDSSKIGNVTITSPALDEPLKGEVVLASQNENPFGSTFAVYQVVRGPGFTLKLPGELNIDKQTGQLKTVFDNLPQLPFEEAEFDFRGGPTAPFVTPNTCGTYQTHSELTSWSGKMVVVDAPMLIDENCAGKGAFNPQLQAGVANPVAGARSPLTIRIKREDGEQNLSRFDVTLPQGEVADLSGVGVCPEAVAASGKCPVNSQVGISTTAIGTGVFPLFVPQPGKDPTALYLAGPYKGAPYSLIAKVPAQSGPFDFGNIVVRTAIDLNPVTAQVIAKSDPLPQILEGVPIQYRDVRIEVQKPDFSVNPTSCEQRFVKTNVYSTQGAVAHPQVPTKVGDCASLAFGPKLAFKLKGGTNRGDFQALTATLTTGKHEANIARASVTLPHSEFLAQEHIGTVCTRVQFAAKACPDASVYGFAKAVTPLLDKPLEGPVYLRSSTHSLPDLVAQLNGQFNIELAGRIDSVNGGIRNTFEAVPDAPVSSFTLKLKGGDKSLLVNSRNLCKSVARADVKLVGQNGKRHNERPVVQNSCSKKAKKKAAKAKSRAQSSKH